MTTSNVTVLKDFLREQQHAANAGITPFQMMADHAPYGIVLLDQSFNMTYLNHQLASWADQSLSTLHKQPLEELVHPEDRALFKRTLKRVWQDGRSYHDIEVRLSNRRAQMRWVAVSLSYLPADDGYVVVNLADISRRKKNEQQLIDLATQDHLTGLANRMMFDESLTKAVKRAKRYNQSGAVLYIDLDKFKQVNDTYGHQTGDAVLKRVAHILNELFRDTDLTARIGGDEFAVIMDAAGADEAEKKATLVEQAIARMVLNVGKKRVTVGASVGVHRFSGSCNGNCDDVMARADAAMYKRKQSA